MRLTARRGVALRSAWFALVVTLLGLGAPAAGHAGPSTFDHYTTGFELLGLHRDVACADCHVGGIFKGTPHDCFACHAPVSRKGATAKPTNHILSNNDCAQCHTPFGWRPVAKFDHLNVFGTCSSCHNKVQAIGKPATHVPTTAECNSCHLVTQPWSRLNFPSNHIPTAPTAQCGDCHKSPDFSVLPSLTDIHANAPSSSANCTQCHGPTTAPTFAIPSAGFSIVTTPASHVPTSAPCESCHVGTGSSIAATPVVNGVKFTNSAMSHAGLTTCVGCHGPTITGASFAGISKIVVMPATSPMGPAAHIPSVTACESCHAGSTPAGLVAANATKTAPGTAFATPVPTTAMIHGAISSGCASCHEAGYLWMDMGNYPISPTAVTGLTTTQYIGFQTRPVAAASSYSVADAAHPATGDCSQCHTGTNYFSAEAEPPNHIPTLPGAACAVCHTTAGNFALYTSNLTALHTEVSTACSTCHADGKGPFAGVSGFKIVQMSTPGRHIPITNGGLPVECSGCHKSVTTFTGTIMSHAAIGDSPVSAAGNACDACHELGFDTIFHGIQIQWLRNDSQHFICGPPGTPTAPNITVCGGGGSDCLTGCHQHANQIPARFKKVRPGTPRKQMQSAGTPPAAAVRPGLVVPRRAGGSESGTALMIAAAAGKVDHTALGGVACQSCHTGMSAAGKGPGHPVTSGACGDCHSTLAWQPVLRLDHADVRGACFTCHDGTHAAGKPAGHPLSGTDCDRCHTTSAWKPAAFDHKSVIAGTCATCHNALKAPGKPAAHVLTTLSCDSCHYVLGWRPVKPSAVTPAPPKKRAPRTAVSPRGRDGRPLAPPQ